MNHSDKKIMSVIAFVLGVLSIVLILVSMIKKNRSKKLLMIPLFLMTASVTLTAILNANADVQSMSQQNGPCAPPLVIEGVPQQRCNKGLKCSSDNLCVDQ